jgi:hypothetical protein
MESLSVVYQFQEEEDVLLVLKDLQAVRVVLAM